MKTFYKLLLLLLPLISYGQAPPVSYASVNENILNNTKWKYTYTSHAESNTIIHKADKGYEYFLYLKYDYTLEHYLNGRTYKDYWKLNANKNEIYYKYRQIEWWKIAEFTKKSLILEFNVTKNAHYRYHFVAVNDADAPFQLGANELPTVDIDAYANIQKNSYRTGSQRRQERKVKKERKEYVKDSIANAPPPEYMKIEVTGGGFYGGLDPVYRDMLVINTDGKILHEILTERKGLQKIKKDIGRKNLEGLIAFIEGKGFFNLAKQYECTNKICERRMALDPLPIPLRIVVTVGSRRKVVTCMIFGKDDKNVQYVDYPKELAEIVDACQRAAQ